jgi:hypothetical protein
MPGSKVSAGLWVRRTDDVLLTGARQRGDVPVGFECAGYSASGAVLDAFTFRRDRYDAPPAPFRRSWGPRIREPHLYGGVLLRHYGHFLLESMSRLWAIRAFPKLPVAWQFFRKHRRPIRWQLEVMELLGIDDRPMILVPRPTRFSTLIVPDAGIRLDSFLHPDQVAALATFQFRNPRKGKRIWLSRRQLTHVTGRVLEEEVVEDRLAKHGWVVISPELLSVRRQLEAMADAEILGGFVGSAFHTLILGRDVQTKVRMLRRYKSDIPVIFDGIAVAKGFDQRLIDVSLEKLNAVDNDALSVNRMADPAEIDRIVEELNA